MFGLAHILAPVSVEEFLKTYRGEKALYIPGKADKYPDFYDWEQINDQINFSRPSRESIRLIYEKQPLDNSHLGKLAEWMVKGATLVINSVQEVDPIISRFATSLGRDMNSSINVNCYASYPSKQGFDTHFDHHDVFVIQTSGEKTWKVYDPTKKYPLDIEPYVKTDPPEVEPYLEYTMKVGDVLYIPRGHWHCAIAVEPSVHLTVSNKQTSGIDFLMWLTENLRGQDEFLRRDIPVVQLNLLGGDQADNEFKKHFKDFREHMKEVFEDDALMESFLQYSMIKNPVPRNFQLPDLALMKDSIDPTTQFKMAVDQKILTRFSEESQGGQLIIRGHVLNMNKVGKNILGILANSAEGAMLSGELLQKANPKASWGDVKTLLLFLFENGILEHEIETNKNPD